MFPTTQMFFALVIAGCFFQAIQAVPVISDPVSPCSEIRVRKEWRDLTVSERQGYIDAVLCLQTIPPKDSTSVALTRYEEFQATHIELTERIHTVGQFLPWHRHLVTLYGDALREDCGYEGPLAFWDWSRDADSDKPMAEWPIFDETLGFGGDGVAGTYTFPPDPQNISAILFPDAWKGCVQTGPFKDLTIHLGPGKLRTSHCLIRGFGEDHWRPVLRTSNLERTLAESDTFKVFHLNIDSLIGGVHSGGHGIIGGEMINVYSAGVDPLFYLHHANLDRVWWLWQRANPDTRLYEIGGYTTQTGNTPITLDFVMDFPGIGENVTVRDVMDNTLAPSCFIYEY